MWIYREPLDVGQILAWADAHYARTGQYPDVTCGRVVDAPEEKWLNIDGSLRIGGRGLPGGWSLAQLLDELRGKRNLKNLPRHTIEQILAWADEHYSRTGAWPHYGTGPVEDAPAETWSAVDMSLRAGTRGLPGGWSLARLLHVHRGVPFACRPGGVVDGQFVSDQHSRDARTKRAVYSKKMRTCIERLRRGRNIQRLPPFTIEQILAWADAFVARHGRRPLPNDGLIEGTRGETWRAVEMALSRGLRGLRGDSSLTRLLAEHRGVRNPQNLEALTIEQILAWAEAHRDRTGNWPAITSGAIEGAVGETWCGVDQALRYGRRNLPHGYSLAQLLDEHRGTSKAQNPEPLSLTIILEWADAWRQRHGRWPSVNSGPIPESPRDNWNAINMALSSGYRSLPGGTTLARLLAIHRGTRNRGALPPVSEEQILSWADAYFARHGEWPSRKSGPVDDAPGEEWAELNRLLRDGRRGLPGGSSLPRLLAQRRGTRNRLQPPSLTEAQVLAWADAYYARHGAWPRKTSGRIDESPADMWQAIDRCLSEGRRGLPGGSSLALLLAAHRGVRRTHNRPPLTIAKILEWADAWHRQYGKWPTTTSGAIPESPGDTWSAIAAALRSGLRGLPAGASLASLLADHRGVRNPAALSSLTEEQILAWADAFFARHGKWPGEKTGCVDDAPGETWGGINQGLADGRRGLRGGSSLAKLLDRCRRKVPQAVAFPVADEAREPQIAVALNGDDVPARVSRSQRASAVAQARPVRLRPK